MKPILGLFKTDITKAEARRARKWIAKLESGEYKQASGVLRRVQKLSGARVSSFCCLGVLCNLSRDDRKLWTIEFDSNEDEFYVNFDGQESMPPETMSASVGLVLDHAYLRDEGDIAISLGFSADANAPDILAKLNDSGWPRSDGKGLTFKQIAKVLERELDAVVTA